MDDLSSGLGESEGMPYLGRGLILLLIVMGLCALVCTPPGLMADEGVFLTIGRAMGDGYLPYRDFWDHKTPGIYFLTWAATRVPVPLGAQRVLVRLLFLSSFLLLALALKIPRRRMLLVLMVAAGATITPLLASHGILTEQGVGFGLILSLAAILASTRKSAWGEQILCVCAGGAAATAIVFSPSSLLPVVVLGMYCVVGKASNEWFRSLLRGLSFVVGAGVVAGCVYAYLSHKGIWNDMIEQAVQANLRFSSSLHPPLKPIIRDYAMRIATMGYLIVLAGLSWPHILGKDRRFGIAAAAVVGACLVAALLPRKGYEHYLIPVSYAIVPLAWPVLSSEKKRVGSGGLSTALVIMTCIPFVGFALPAAGAFAARILRPRPLTVAEYQMPELQRYVHPGDTVWYAGGVDCQLYWYTGCRPATRYLYMTEASDFLKTSRDEIVRDLQKNKPSLIVVYPGWKDDRGRLNGQVPPNIRSIMERDYRVAINRAGAGIVYTRM